MSDPLEVAREAQEMSERMASSARGWRARRDAAVAAAVAAGETEREVARALGLSPAMVHKIVVRGASRA